MGKFNKIALSLLALCGSSFGAITSVAAEEASPSATSVKATIPVTCEASGSSETFTYILISADKTGNETIKTSEIQLKDGEEGFFEIEYAAIPATYDYQIEQVKGSDANTTYDETIYDLKVYVVNDSEEESNQDVLYAEPVVFVNGSDKKCEKVAFKNTYTAPASPTPTPSQNNGNKRTGAGSGMLKWLAIMAVSAGGLFVLAKKKKDDKEDDNKPNNTDSDNTLSGVEKTETVIEEPLEETSEEEAITNPQSRATNTRTGDTQSSEGEDA